MTWIGQRPAMTCEFAKRCGFSTRRHRTEGKDGVGKGLTRRYFVCHRAASSIQAYEIFGDAVVFYATHRLTALDMPLEIWVGVNNYGVPCFFGCALLREENLRSFSWALKAPQTILTDQNMCLKEAIAMEMPATKHALSVWMIVVKFPSWFNAVLGEHYNEWKAEFFRLYNLESIEDFELGWRDIVNSFGLHTNRHIANLFALRMQWALPDLRTL
ncbi:hypothetical protein Patl1_26873 [Pistacia atlantica]|uniref:Uncharacterized protein n=1 Tax=Pistacia atlantica TaxID=434234 RepID=A0ACC1B090_9ROSI|nr:hypothetical protein Patl1_26873 [Pistacia atlantica]